MHPDQALGGSGAPNPEEFCARIAGQTIADIDRREKFLLLLLEKGNQVVIHLRMTGGLLLMPADIQEEPHTHTEKGCPSSGQNQNLSVVFLWSNGKIAAVLTAAISILVETEGFEPLTLRMRTVRSPKLRGAQARRLILTLNIESEHLILQFLAGTLCDAKK